VETQFKTRQVHISLAAQNRWNHDVDATEKAFNG
jgi:hypothetical protein